MRRTSESRDIDVGDLGACLSYALVVPSRCNSCTQVTGGTRPTATSLKPLRDRVLIMQKVDSDPRVCAPVPSHCCELCRRGDTRSLNRGTVDLFYLRGLRWASLATQCHSVATSRYVYRS